MMRVIALLLITGLGGPAHALSNDCANGHCDDHMTAIMAEHQAMNVSGEGADTTQHGSNGMEHEDCNPFLCYVLALTSMSTEAVFDQSATTLIWQVTSLSTLEEPENPERPPNL
jgi:hypothetical protein